MNIQLIDYTGHGHPSPSDRAANLLIFAKSTRLKMSVDLMQQIEGWDAERRRAELAYIANTIPSSWEYVSYTFMISGVSRAMAEQFKRNRQGSYAQQTMRMLDVSGFEYHTGPTIDNDPDNAELYDATMQMITEAYSALIAGGAKIEDARGILPLNIHTNLVAKFNLRTLSEMLRKRSSSRVQGEFRDVVAAMRACILEVHPWAEYFIDSQKDKLMAELNIYLDELRALSLDHTERDATKERIATNIAKIFDRLVQE